MGCIQHRRRRKLFSKKNKQLWQSIEVFLIVNRRPNKLSGTKSDGQMADKKSYGKQSDDRSKMIFK